jgi:hypothetical protein
MISASALMRNCGHPRVLKNRPPTTQRERDARARRDEAAARGTTFHAAIETWLKEGAPPMLEDAEMQGWLDLLAMQWAPPPGARVEVPWGLTPAGDHAHVDEPEPHVYTSPDPLITAGRADVSWLGFDGRVYVLDWKTGKWPVTPAASNLQVNAAGIALAREIVAPAYVPGIYYTRDGAWDWGEPVEIGSVAHAEILADVHAAALLDNEPRPGDHCQTCWERRACTSAQIGAA